MSVALSADSIVAALPAHVNVQWLADRRAEAVERLQRHGFPAKDPNWKGTNIPAFTAPREAPRQDSLTAVDLQPFHFEEIAHVAVVVDGRFRADLSRLDALPHDVHVESLAQAITRASPVLSEHLGTSTPTDRFADWNMAAWTDGVFITTAANVVLDEPIHVLNVRTPQPNTVCFPRLLVHVRENAELTVIEHHAGIADADTATIAVTELVAHDGARLRHERIQEEWTSARHMHSVFVRADRDARIERSDACLGGGQSRLTVEGVLAGPGAHLGLNGFFLTGGERRCDVWTRFDHAAPHTTSQEMVKGVLGDAARGTFTGNVLVRQDAQKIHAEQQNRNLLLSRKALMDSQPQLEIHADDVQCSHGSTVGQLDDDALFFLRSRGIGLEQARLVLTKAFLGEVVEGMHPTIRNGINRRIEAWFQRHPQSLEIPA